MHFNICGSNSDDNNKKTFVIINSYFIGDIILTSSLIQNIKRLYKDSRVVMITSEKLKTFAMDVFGVDDAIVWDRVKDKSFFKMLKFVKNFPYKNIYAAIPIYGTDRPILLSKMLGAKNILVCGKKNIYKFLVKSKYKIETIKGNIQLQDLHLLSGLTKEKLINERMKFKKTDSSSVLDKFNLKDTEYFALCPVSSKVKKDMPKETVFEIIKTLGAEGKNVALLSSGPVAKELSEFLGSKGLQNLIDLTNKTTILEAKDIISASKGVISVDTGLLHIACAVNVPVAGIYYAKDAREFVPDENLYRCKNIFENFTTENILEKFYALIG